MVLYRLASHPEFVPELREEVEAVVAKHGWTKSSVQKMHNVDSFIRETLRLDNLGTSACVCSLQFCPK